jgi:thiol:disulfide interchange protein DsbD
MGVAMGYAFTQPPEVIFAVFLALSVGFALPFLILCLYTPLLRKFPKPGPWMETFKEFMAFPIYASVAWLLWVLVQQTGERGLLASLISLILIVFAVWLRKKYDPKTAFGNAGFIGLTAALIFYPTVYLVKTPTYVTIDFQSYTKQALQDLRTQKKPVFVYATAAWCLTCKANELALKSNATDELFNRHEVTLMEADWTNQNEGIRQFLEEHGRHGVPLYLYYPPDKEPIILPQILTESIIKETVELLPKMVSPTKSIVTP